MKLGCLLVFTFFASFSNAQNMTGIWRGYFLSGSGAFQQRYTYEVQIDQLKNKKNDIRSGLKGVTYSYRSADFYGKASLVGIYNSDTKELTIAEDTLTDVHNTAGMSCLMTCYLGYRKDGKNEILEGKFTSMNDHDKSDCGPGYVYLQRVEESDFHKEAFLEKKSSSPSATAKTAHATPKTVAPDTVAALPRKKWPMPSGKNFDMSAAGPKTLTPQPAQPEVRALPPVPPVLKERENTLFQTIVTHSPDVKIELYDNGVVDGDTITVYHNNQLIVDSKELTEKPITINIKADSINTHHEFVMVANNLGTIPPNTALMVVTTGGKRYEINISSDEKKNAKLVIDYEP